jgi:hypothetical protein
VAAGLPRFVFGCDAACSESQGYRGRHRLELGIVPLQSREHAINMSEAHAKGTKEKLWWSCRRTTPKFDRPIGPDRISGSGQRVI